MRVIKRGIYQLCYVVSLHNNVFYTADCGAIHKRGVAALSRMGYISEKKLFLCSMA